jgi:2-keto-3-deoxy-6-phosphogluconate aldolase
MSVGGSWITERNLVREKRWVDIQRLASEAVSLCGH